MIDAAVTGLSVVQFFIATPFFAIKSAMGKIGT